MAGTSGRGGLGWAILVFALAVPGVMFFNWWSHLKADREKAVAAKARGRVPDGGVFQSSPNSKLVNPMTPAVSTAAPAAVTQAPAPAETVSVSSPAVGAAAAPPAASTLAVSSTAVTGLPLKRDPTLSPFDQVRILEEEEIKRAAAEALANLKKPRGPKAIKTVDPKTLVDLQGIISNPESGFKAIVNNEVVSVGETVGKVRIVRITDGGVVFEYKGKRFSKSVSRD